MTEDDWAEYYRRLAVREARQIEIRTLAGWHSLNTRAAEDAFDLMFAFSHFTNRKLPKGHHAHK